MMIRIRLFEEKVTELKLMGDIKGPVHTCIGQEAVSTGVCLALSKEDYIIGNHRSHGYMIAKGADVRYIMAEIFGKSTGINGGKGGSMHINDKSVGGMGSTGIVGSGLPVACGIAFADKFKNDGRITCVFFGDGAANEGTFYECMNLASKWELPLLFILENNGVAVTTLLDTVSSPINLVYRAAAFEINQQIIDGQYVSDVFNATTRSLEAIRKYNRPAIIEMKTIRFAEHQVGAAYEAMKKTGYRDSGYIDYCIETKDPIQLYCGKLVIEGAITLPDIDQIYEEETKRIDEAVNFAINSSVPENAYKNIYS